MTATHDYLEKKYWDVPTQIVPGDASVEPIYLSVGAACSFWEELETELAYLFKFLVEGKSEAAFRVYGRQVGLRSKQDALKEAGSVFFGHRPGSGDPRKILEKITSAYGHAAERRNDIVHGVVVGHGAKGKHLFPPSYSSRKNRFTAIESQLALTLEVLQQFTETGELKKDEIEQNLPQNAHKYAYTAAQINHYSVGFLKLAAYANSYYQDLAKKFAG